MELTLKMRFKEWMRRKKLYRDHIRYAGNVSNPRFHPYDELRKAYILLMLAFRRRNAYVRGEKSFLCPKV